MGNTTNSNSAPSSPVENHTPREDSTAKRIHISTNQSDGFYFTGERILGTVKIPTSFLHHYLHHHQHHHRRTSLGLFNKRSLRHPIAIELVGDATYSAEVDSAADSDGHATHKVNLCRQCSVVNINQYRFQSEATLNTCSSSEINLIPINLPSILNGTFNILIPEGLPPSLPSNHAPSVVYTLELSLPSTHSRYQIPITLSTRGCLPNSINNNGCSDSVTNKNDIYLRASLLRNFYRPGEQIPVRIYYSNPQQRIIRSIKIQLLQFYRVHNDQNRLLIDGKEWIFDVQAVPALYEWTNEAYLQLPNQPLQASYPTNSVGTTKSIECELDYRIFVELHEKKGDNINVTLTPIQVTYQK